MSILTFHLLLVLFFNTLVWGYGFYLAEKEFLSWIIVALWSVMSLGAIGLYTEFQSKQDKK